MKHYVELIEDKICNSKAQRQYCIDCMNAGQLETWESKEYSDLIEQYEQEIVELNQRLEMVRGWP